VRTVTAAIASPTTEIHLHQKGLPCRSTSC
jgi:hypothetical protein